MINQTSPPRRVVEIVEFFYQPTKAELEEEFMVPEGTTPKAHTTET